MSDDDAGAETKAESPSVDTLCADYQTTIGIWREYATIRFKLLGLLPLATAIGVGVTGDQLTYTTAAVAAGALVAIVGIVMYDLRNSLFYDSAIHRAKALEKKLALPRTNHANDEWGRAGIFGERPRDPIRFLGLRAWHDRALNIVYSSSVAAWAGLLAASLVTEADLLETDGQRWFVALAAAVLAFVGFFRAVDNTGDQIGRIRRRM